MSDGADNAAIHRFHQAATIGNLMPMALRNALLTIVTFTLYRFWARTEIRRRLWSGAVIMGDPLEYAGTGWELFRGFLISIPVFFLPAIFVLYVAPLILDRGAATLLLLGFYAFAVPLIALAHFLMRRYQLSRTRWRGIRFGLDGSAFAYAAASSGWTLLEIVTLGFYAPAARMRRAKAIWENTRFGDQPFEFAVGETQLAKGLGGPFALGWFGFLFSWIITIIVIGSMIMMFAPAMLQPGAAPGAEPLPEAVAVSVAIGLGGILVFILAYALCWMPYNAAAMNRIAELLTLDGARFRLRATSMGVFGVTLASAAVFIFSLGLLAPISGLIYTRYVINRLELIGAPRFAEIGQSKIIGPRSGEGIADAFDLDFGVGVL
ncbi:MAG: YjgN family protein [Hyphomonadaceae bacterium]